MAAILLDYIRAKEGNDNENRGNILDRLRAEAINDNGERLCDFCQSNFRKVCGTLALATTLLSSCPRRTPNQRHIGQLRVRLTTS